jgi:hypothetical protein
MEQSGEQIKDGWPVEVTSTATEQSRLTFSHPLMQEVVLNTGQILWGIDTMGST